MALSVLNLIFCDIVCCKAKDKEAEGLILAKRATGCMRSGKILKQSQGKRKKCSGQGKVREKSGKFIFSQSEVLKF